MAKRVIQPVELHDAEKEIISKLKTQHRKVARRPISVAELIRRSVRFAGPKFLSGEAPLVEAVTINKPNR
jgi:hypothetical protein